MGLLSMVACFTMVIRIIDIIAATVGLVVFSPIIIIIYMIGLFDTGCPLFIQQRVGRDKRLFKLIKFRTMHVNTAQVGTHLAKSSDITQTGAFLRRSKLDELPQLINVITGSMSLVGPRPCLPTQTTLLNERNKRSVLSVRPGITGLGQINNIDMSTPRKLSRYDQLMNKNMDLVMYFSLITATIFGKGSGDKIKQ